MTPSPYFTSEKKTKYPLGYLIFVSWQGYPRHIYDKLYTLDGTRLSTEQKTAPKTTLVKLRSMVYQKMKQLK